MNLTLSDIDRVLELMDSPTYALYEEYAHQRMAEAYRDDALSGDVSTESGRFAMAAGVVAHKIFNGYGNRLRADLEQLREARLYERSLEDR